MRQLFIVLSFFVALKVQSQILFSESFATFSLSVNTYTVMTSQGIATVSTSYTDVPANFSVINDGYKNNSGSVLAPNKPFNIAALKYQGWALAYNESVNDTFLVSTSWLDSTTTTAVSRFVITPTINIGNTNAILSWEAMSADGAYPEGYQVFITTSTNPTLTANDFNVLPVFSLADGNTQGAGEKNTWTKRAISLSSYAGQTIRIAFKNLSRNMYQLWLDNIKVEAAANSLDAAISEGQPIYKYGLVNKNYSMNCRITNNSPTTINAVTLNYSVDNGVPQQQFFNVSLTPYQFSDLAFSTPYSSGVAGLHSIKIWLSNVNGLNDPNKTNDTLYSSLSLMTVAPSKNVLVEQFLSATDGYSPDGQQKLNDAIGTSTSIVQVNIHDDDSLKATSISNLITDYKKKNSTALIDRNYFYDINAVPVERASYATRINQRTSAVVPVSISIVNKNFNTSTRVLDFTLQATFSGDVKGDYRIISYLTENVVYGPETDKTLNGWNQLNLMYNTPWSPYYQLGNFDASANNYVMDAFQYKHKWVLDFALDGAYGNPGLIPTNGVTTGQTFNAAYSFTIPVSLNNSFRYNPDDMYIVSFVAEYNSDLSKRTVLNCMQEKITASPELVSVNEIKSQSEFELYPNPSKGNFYISIPEQLFKKQPEIVLTDLLGKEVYSGKADITFGLLELKADQLQNGTYFISLRNNETIMTKKLVICR